MREIEIKAKVSDKTSLIEKLTAARVILGEPLKQRDVVYAQPGAIVGSHDANWLRIRTENDSRHIFNLKRSVTNGLDSIEHEVTIDNDTEMRSIIKYLGYELFSDLTKIRQKTSAGNIEICVDEVPELGVYIEAEMLCPEDADADAIRGELWRLLESFGVSRVNEETNGYDILMRRKLGLPA